MVRKQLPQIPEHHVIGEPVMRDVGPAVGLAAAILTKVAPETPMAILWSDHLVRKEELFRKILETAEQVVKKERDKVVFIAQKPRFASQNLGWITYGPQVQLLNGVPLNAFVGFKYRPDLPTAEKYFTSGNHAWNLGYFVTTPAFLFKKYKEFVPEMHKQLAVLQNAWGTPAWDATLQKIYPTLEKIHFDNAILEKLKTHEAYVISEDLAWSDIGAWEALKEALQESPTHNVTNGNVLVQDSNDSLVYNYNNKQLLVAIDLSGMLVINTADVTVVCKKESVPKIKKLVESMNGTPHEHLT